MEIVKKNMLSILCGVVALIAVIAIFFPLGGWFDKLQTSLVDRSKMEQQLDRLVKTQRTLPVIGINDQAKPLAKFPNAPAIKQVQASITEQLVNEAKTLQADAFRYNKGNHTLMTERSLPNSNDAAKFNFQTDDEAKLTELREKVLVGCMPPTQAEITARTADLRKEKDRLLQYVNGQPTNQPAVDAQFNEEKDRLPATMRMEAALSHKIYIFPPALWVDPSISNHDKHPTPDQIWYAQVGYWVAQDVCNAIAETNADSPNILKSPVKALVRLDLPVTSALYTLAALPENNMGGSRRPEPVVETDPDAKLISYPNLSLTGRACNPLFDVVQFNMSVNVDARYAAVFLRNLSKDRFITVKQLNMNKLDLDEENGGTAALRQGAGDNGPVTGFIYGKDVPMARMDMQCEELFLRSWTVQWMPASVKHDLGIPVGPGASPGN